jgi:class 3 adenylate cyclase
MEPLGLRVRIGIHIGECELHEDKVTGMAVLVGARIAAIAGPGEVLVSGTTRDLVAGSGLAFSDRGDHQLKGLPGTWSIHEASGMTSESPMFILSACTNDGPGQTGKPVADQSSEQHV